MKKMTTDSLKLERKLEYDGFHFKMCNKKALRYDSKQENYGQRQSVMIKQILLISLLFYSCALYVPQKYWYSSEIKGSHGGHFKSDSDIPFVVLEEAAIIDSVQFPDSLFNKDASLPYQIGEITDYITKGNDKYLFMYRNYMSSCCDSKDVGTIVFLICIKNGEYDSSKSIILETGPWQLPHMVFWPKDITSIEVDNSLRIFAEKNGKEFVFNGMININHNWKITDYKASKKEIESKL